MNERRPLCHWKRCVVAGLCFTASMAHGQALEEALDAIAEEVRGDGESANEWSPSASSANDTLNDPFANLPRNVNELLVVQQFDKGMAKRLGGGKVSGRLLKLTDDRSSKSLSGIADQAKALGIPFDRNNQFVEVRLFADSEDSVPQLVGEVERRGGQVDATFDNVVLGRLPLNSVKSAGRHGALYFMDAGITYHPLSPNSEGGYGRTVSEGVGLVNADALHRAGVTGRGVKVGILDFGFQRYSSLENSGEVPRAVAKRAFNRAGRLEANTVHGTGCAEIIADMAPNAALYLAAVDGAEGQIVAAGKWLAEQGVDIINFSGGGHVGPHNGSALLDRFVDYVVREHGVLWVNAAGNEGASHWTTIVQDRNRNGFVDNVDSRYPDLIALAGQSFQVKVMWDDWGRDPSRPTSSQDIDAYLLTQTASGLVPVAASRQVQNGRGVPLEIIGVQNVPRNQVLYLALHLKSVTRSGLRARVVVEGAQMTPLVPSGSVGIPATSRGALAVAAVEAATDSLEAYSSRGPTDDNRLKPEVSGPDKTVSMAYERQGGAFPGTSAAAPHVAGFAALLKEMNPGWAQPALREAVMSHVTPKGRRSPNVEYGHGRIDAAGIQVRGRDEGREDRDDPPRGQDQLDDQDLERALRDILNSRDD